MYRDELGFSPLATSLTWHWDRDTSEGVAVCDSCGADLRVSKNIGGGELNFEHEAGCSWMDELEKKNTSRAWDLAESVAEILDHEPDFELALSALIVVVGVVCNEAAKQNSSLTTEVAGWFARELERRIVSISEGLSEGRQRDEAA